MGHWLHVELCNPEQRLGEVLASALRGKPLLIMRTFAILIIVDIKLTDFNKRNIYSFSSRGLTDHKPAEMPAVRILKANFVFNVYIAVHKPFTYSRLDN